ncbi:hypothetical protein NKH77_05190 [Streptomyces sp. M19]
MPAPRRHRDAVPRSRGRGRRPGSPHPWRQGGDESGRGLLLVDALCTSWGSRTPERAPAGRCGSSCPVRPCPRNRGAPHVPRIPAPGPPERPVDHFPHRPPAHRRHPRPVGDDRVRGAGSARAVLARALRVPRRPVAARGLRHHRRPRRARAADPGPAAARGLRLRRP